MKRVLIAAVLAAAAAAAALIPDVRELIARKDFAGAERQIAAHRKQNGVTPEMLEAHSWLGRGALADKQWDRADGYAAETRKLALELLKRRALDAEPRLPIALGASIEVQAQAMAGRGARSEAVAFLERELATYRTTSIRTRIQKNINLLSLVGKPAPSVESGEWLGPKPPPLAALKGKPVLLFFWAHWCPDCKLQAPVLARVREIYGPKGLILLAPTRLYGYTARGEDADPRTERPYIEEVRRRFYSAIIDVPAPLSEEVFQLYGASTTPTLVLVDRGGLVRLYHPGRMTFDELAASIDTVLK